MKRTTIIALVAFFLFFGGTLAAESLTDNQYLKKSVELRVQATVAFDTGEYDESARLAAEAKDWALKSDEYIARTLAEARAAADKAAADARAAAEKAAADKATADKAAADAKAAANAKAAADAKAAAELAAARAAAETAIGAAESRLAWAESVGARSNYPKEYASASEGLAEAKLAFAGEDYATAQGRAEEVLASLAGISEAIPWPATYKVRSIPKRSDCLWRIAEYPFIYNDPLKWPIIYEANKKTFRDPSNPNLIFPGQILVIPSMNGESRQGSFDPDRVYATFPK